jgi:phenylalanyl-tRNA synthetase beta chain
VRVSQSWLTELLQAGAPGWSASVDELDAGFVRVGFEIEGVHPLPEITGPLVVGRIAQITELTEFKKPIRFCQVDVGAAEPQGIVCGARNFAEGDLIVAALPGAVLPGGFAISSRKTYGQVSDGMICSVSELGIGHDHSGILVLPPGTADVGADAKDVLGLSDTVFDVNVTPDRGYAFSMRGLSREIAGSFEVDFVDPGSTDTVPVPASSDAGWPVGIDAASGATRYAAQVIRSIDPNAVTPWWMQRRLLLAGVRPISPAVDVTNYVMMELGQPLHAFDAAKLSGGITVRRAAAGEKLTTLDDTVRVLDVEDVVIADESGPIAMAGVMGGADTEVGNGSVDILLEAATFDPVAVFRTAKRHKLSSEASKRFERVVDPEVTAVALQRAARLIAEIAGGTIESDYTDVHLDTPATPTIEFPADTADKVAGTSYPAGTAKRWLEQIGATVVGTDILTVTPPSWRPDLTERADLVEEVLRLQGYDTIPVELPSAPAGTGLTAAQRRRRAIGTTLALSGYTEVLPFPFMPAGALDSLDIAADDARRRTVTVLNPLEADRAQLNTTLLPGLLEMVSRNVSRGQRDLSLYAIGQVYFDGDNVRAVDPVPVDRRPTDAEIATIVDALPTQPLHVAAVLTGDREPSGPWGVGRPADATDAFEAARLIGEAAGVDVELVAAQQEPWHPGRCAAVTVDGETVGYAGELTPAVVDRLGLPPRTCAVEIDIDGLPLVNRYVAPQLSPFPAVLQDLAVVVPTPVPASAVQAALTIGAGELLEEITLFDQFTGPQVGEGNKSLTFALRFRAADRTLTEDEASAARDAAVAAAAGAVGARLRA